MSDIDNIMDGIAGRQSLDAAREACKAMIRSYKMMGADLEEALCLVETMPLHNIPLAQLWIDRYWDEVTP